MTKNECLPALRDYDGSQLVLHVDDHVPDDWQRIGEVSEVLDNNRGNFKKQGRVS